MSKILRQVTTSNETLKSQINQLDKEMYEIQAKIEEEKKAIKEDEDEAARLA